MNNDKKSILLGLIVLFSSVTLHINAGPSSSKIALGSTAAVIIGGSLVYSSYVRSMPPAPMDLELPQSNSGITTLFAHGFGGDKRHGTSYAGIGAVESQQLSVFNFEDVDRSLRTHLAGTGDVATLQKAVQENLKAHPTKKLELFGVSRGASTVLHYLATASRAEIDRIAGAIVESPFKNRTDIVRRMLEKIRKDANDSDSSIRSTLRVSARTAEASVNALPAPIPGSIVGSVLPNTGFLDAYPGNKTHQIPKTTPILFVCSEEDTLIPASSTEKMFTDMKAAGHNVRMLKFEHGPHANIITYNEDNHQRYIAALQSFRAQYPTQ